MVKFFPFCLLIRPLAFEPIPKIVSPKPLKPIILSKGTFGSWLCLSKKRFFDVTQTIYYFTESHIKCSITR